MQKRIIVTLVVACLLQTAFAQDKELLIIGAGHVISVKEMLKQVYPELHVVLMYDAE
jgi:hypothetical protein